jgi:hypothetical protein
MLIKGKGHKCIFIPKFYYKLNKIEMYSKGRYRQVKKTSFEHVKKEVIIALDACNINIMRRFVNRLYKFIDAYRKGLSAKAAI